MPDKLLLAVNCGSSSIKFKLFALPSLDVLISGSASNVAVKGARATVKFVTHADEDHQEREEEDEGMECERSADRLLYVWVDTYRR